MRRIKKGPSKDDPKYHQPLQRVNNMTNLNSTTTSTQEESSKIKNSDPHHSFSLALATRYGMEEAILIHHFQHWLGINKRLKRNIFEGRVWTYQTIKEIHANFPYWSIKQVERLLNKLYKIKVLLKGNFNQNRYDRTVWYSLNDDSFKEIDFPKSGNHNPEIGTPIPDTKPYTKTTTIPTLSKGEMESEMFSFGEKIKMKKFEYEKLCKQKGTEYIQKILEEMDLWLSAHGKTYKNYASAIGIWINKREKEQKTSPPKVDKNENKQRNLLITNELTEKLSLRYVNGNYINNIQSLDHVFIDKNLNLQTSLYLEPEEFKKTLQKYYTHGEIR